MNKLRHHAIRLIRTLKHEPSHVPQPSVSLLCGGGCADDREDDVAGVDHRIPDD
jgi:hypothetical protein